MKSAEEIMEILEGFDLTGSYRDAAELAGCSPNTVARYVAARDAGTLVPGRAAPRPQGDRGVPAQARGARRAVQGQDPRRRGPRQDHGDGVRGVASGPPAARSRRSRRRGGSGRRRVYRPWIPEPGMWAQYDFGEGPRIGGRADDPVLFLVGVVPVPGRVPAAGQDPAQRVRRDRHRAAPDRWGAPLGGGPAPVGVAISLSALRRRAGRRARRPRWCRHAGWP